MNRSVDGPRALRADEWDQLNELVGTVFRPSMFHDYPQLFNEANRENLRVVSTRPHSLPRAPQPLREQNRDDPRMTAVDGKVVSHVGMTERPATLMGCRVDVACIGAVATFAEYRGRGFASAVFQDACDKAARDGIDFMLISGGRGLYTRVGCRPFGRDPRFDITLAHAAALRELAPQVEMRAVERIDPAAEALAALYEAEPVRFLRPRQDWEMALDCRVVMNRRSDFWACSLGGRARAYCVVQEPAPERRDDPASPLVARVAEFAGDRAPLAAALGSLVGRDGVARVHVRVAAWDLVLQAILESCGVPGVPTHATATLRVINFVQLMERLRPYLAGRLGPAVDGLEFWAEASPGAAEGSFAIRRGAQELRISCVGDLAVYLFGTVDAERAAAAAPEGSKELQAALAPALPLPALWYGLNYI